jgi:hypothetical protein
MNALHTPSPGPPLARPASAMPAAAGAALPPAGATRPAAMDPLEAQVVEDRLRALFRLSTRRGLIHPLHHVMLRYRKEALPPCAAQEARA